MQIVIGCGLREFEVAVRYPRFNDEHGRVLETDDRVHCVTALAIVRFFNANPGCLGTLEDRVREYTDGVVEKAERAEDLARETADAVRGQTRALVGGRPEELAGEPVGQKSQNHWVTEGDPSRELLLS